MHNTLIIPADVPPTAHEEYRLNYQAMTLGTGNLFLLAADHKIEHLDGDMYGPNIDKGAHNPEHFFKIASKSRIGALATQLGLISRYGKQYPHINYVIKLNSKTNLIPATHKEPFSRQLWTVQEVVDFKASSGLSIRGIGLTIYLGSEYEDLMLAQATKGIYEAHQHGLIATLWIYPRGKAITNPTDWNLLAGAAGLATCLGADFVKLHPPHAEGNKSSSELLKLVVEAAGTTKVICAGGERRTPEIVIQELKEQLAVGGTAGAALGRNIWQHSVEDAIKLADEISALIYGQIP